jgi:hypothetical protein
MIDQSTPFKTTLENLEYCRDIFQGLVDCEETEAISPNELKPAMEVAQVCRDILRILLSTKNVAANAVLLIDYEVVVQELNDKVIQAIIEAEADEDDE